LTGTPEWMADALLRPLLAQPATAAVARTLTRPLPGFPPYAVALMGWPLRAPPPAVPALARPLPACAAYAVALIGWHLPAPYNAALEIHGWHVIEHLMLLVTATLGWWPILSPSTLVPPLPYAAQLLYLFVFGMPMTVVAAMVTAAERVLYPFYEAAPRITELTALADQRLGGVIMWVPSGLIPLAAFTAVFFRRAAAEGEGAV